MSLRKIVDVGTLFFLLFSTSITQTLAQSCKVNRTQLKQMYMQDLNKPPALQDVVWGPFKNGGSLRVQYEYAETGKGTQYIRESDPACVQIDRGDVVRAAFLVDAFYECQRLGVCENLPAYSHALFNVKSAKDLPFLEDAQPELSPSMQNWCLGKPYSRSWLAAVPGVILGLQTHEFAHALLHEALPLNEELEAEADGFAAYITEIADVRSAGVQLSASSLALTQFVKAERNYELIGGSHPPSECRIEAALLGLRAWYESRQTVRAPQQFAQSTVEPFLTKALSSFLPKKYELCSRYELAFDRGVRKAADTITISTNIDFIFGVT